MAEKKRKNILDSEVTTAIFIIASFKNEEEKVEGGAAVTQNMKMPSIIQGQGEDMEHSAHFGTSEKPAPPLVTFPATHCPPQ